MTDRFLSFGAVCVLGLCALLAPSGGAARASERLERVVDSADTPRPVPLTRPEMKRLIEDVKVRRTRIPMPELSEADRQALGDRADDYETVLRHLYTPWSSRNRGPRGPRTAAQRQREQDPAMTLDYAFKTELFWIVSRVNNCQYCMGHQESKLLGAGLSEDEIAALDGDWSRHTPAERAAFAFARQLSYQPHELTDADIDALREHYTDLQILEMAMSVSRNNVSNRWKEGIGVQQRADEGGYSRVEDNPALPRGTYLTPTSEPFQNAISKVAPITFDRSGDPVQLAICRRPPLESAAEVEQALSAASRREARLPLVSEDQARAVLGDRAPEGPPPQWIRLLANFPQDGLGHITSVLDADEQGDLSPLLKAQLSWIIARQDRAWYALGQARHRLREQGQSEEQIHALDSDWQQFTPREQSLFRVAKKLGASPVVITDQDVSEAVALAGPRDVVQTIHFTTMRAFFNRVTEAAGLQIDQ